MYAAGWAVTVCGRVVSTGKLFSGWGRSSWQRCLIVTTPLGLVSLPVSTKPPTFHPRNRWSAQVLPRTNLPPPPSSRLRVSSRQPSDAVNQKYDDTLSKYPCPVRFNVRLGSNGKKLLPLLLPSVSRNIIQIVLYAYNGCKNSIEYLLFTNFAHIFIVLRE